MPSRVYVSLPEGREVAGELLEAAAFAVLDAEGVSDGQVSVTILGDEPIRELNIRWRGHDWIPDVLSFALHASGDSPVGDIYVGLDQASRQAREHDVPVEEELVRLVIHGALHVLGYDHPEGEDRDGSELYRRQEVLVRSVLPETTRGARPGQERQG